MDIRFNLYMDVWFNLYGTQMQRFYLNGFQVLSLLTCMYWFQTEPWGTTKHYDFFKLINGSPPPNHLGYEANVLTTGQRDRSRFWNYDLTLFKWPRFRSWHICQVFKGMIHFQCMSQRTSPWCRNHKPRGYLFNNVGRSFHGNYNYSHILRAEVEDI